MPKSEVLSGIPLKVRVLWVPHYYVDYPEELHTEPEDITDKVATHYGFIGEYWYGTVVMSPRLLEVAPPEAMGGYVASEAEALWDDIKVELFGNSEQGVKFVDAMSKALLTAVMYRKAGVV
jgi:hypothetical protein